MTKIVLEEKMLDCNGAINEQPTSNNYKGMLLFAVLFLSTMLTSCEGPKEQVVLRRIKDVVVEGSTEPTLKAQAIFYNPNTIKMKLKRINVDVYVNEKKVAVVNQELHTMIPAKSEFTIPLEVKLAMKEIGLLDTLLGFLGGKKFDVRYEGHIKLSYHGLPIRVPVHYKDEIRIKF